MQLRFTDERMERDDVVSSLDRCSRVGRAAVDEIVLNVVGIRQPEANVAAARFGVAGLRERTTIQSGTPVLIYRIVDAAAAAVEERELAVETLPI